MSSTVYVQHFADGSARRVRRSVKQGRKSSGLAAPQVVRLYEDDKARLAKRAAELGYLYNENEFIRDAVRMRLDEIDGSVYTELVKS